MDHVFGKAHDPGGRGRAGRSARPVSPDGNALDAAVDLLAGGQATGDHGRHQCVVGTRRERGCANLADGAAGAGC